METITIDILNPKVKKTLQKWLDLNLIKISSENVLSKEDFLTDLKLSLKQAKEGKVKPLSIRKKFCSNS